MTSTPTTVDHPARFHPDILTLIAALVPAGAHVHDPYAGTGERLGAVADEHGWTFTGTEIEPSFIVDARVAVGDATDPSTYPSDPHVIVTSPVYPNGIADHFEAKDGSRRFTYRRSVALNEGADRPLHENNMGRYGYRGTGPKSTKRIAYWDLATRTVACWTAGLALVNVKNFVDTSVVEDLVGQWEDLLEVHGYTVVIHTVKVPGIRYGTNRWLRVEGEAILEARR
jgi:hypothetical protein